LQVVATAGFNGTITLSCSNAPTHATCSVAPASVVANGATTVAFTVTVSMTAGSSVAPFTGLFKNQPRTDLPFQLAWLLSLALLLGIAVQRSRNRTLLPATGFVLLALMFLGGCGNSGGRATPPPGAPQSTTSLTIQGASGGKSHNITLTLVSSQGF
jgi:hypothetical protein